MELTKFEVVLKNKEGDWWTMTWRTTSFAEAEALTLLQLERNGDTHSYIHRIELW